MNISMPITAWPEQDRSMPEALRQKGGPFDDTGALSDLRETSLRMYKQPYGRWLQWLQSDTPAALGEAPVQRATVPRLQRWLESLCTVSPTSRQMYFTGTLQLLKAAAPDADWSAHTRLKNRLSRAAGRGDPARKEGRVLSSKFLLDCAMDYAESAIDGAHTPLTRAKRHRDGTMVALLAVMPIRHRAFASLSIGASLLVSPKKMTVVLSGDLTKNGQTWEADVPGPVSILLRQYLDVTRPFLLARGRERHDMLWVCNRGSPMSYSYVGQKIPEVTMALTGKPIPPHFFRDAAATTLARASPNDATLIRPVLGHSDFRTAEKHYIHAGSIEIVRSYFDLLREMRKKG